MQFASLRQKDDMGHNEEEMQTSKQKRQRGDENHIDDFGRDQQKKQCTEDEEQREDEGLGDGEGSRANVRRRNDNYMQVCGCVGALCSL